MNVMSVCFTELDFKFFVVSRRVSWIHDRKLARQH